MIEGLQPYPQYRDSGISWVPQIPSHWQTARNGHLFQQRNDTGHPQLPILEVSLKTGVRVRNFETSKRKQVMADFAKYKRAAAGDIAYNMMRMWQGAVGVAPVDGLVSPAYVVARPYPNTESRYYASLFRMDLYLGEIDAVSRGIVKDRNRLYWDQFKQMRSLAPPPDEQAAIVRFLDHANRKIDRFIRNKRKLIGLLNEQKQAIIHRAVTRGLNPDVKLRPTGIPWLGDIPEHWEAKKLKSLVKTVGGMTPNKNTSEFWGGAIPWVTPKDMKVRTIRDSRDHITNAALWQTGISMIEPPAVLIVVRGMILTRTFPTAITTIPVTVNQDMKALLPRSGLVPNYFVSLLTGIQRDLLLLVDIAGHGTCCLRTESWASFTIPVPPLDEQHSISEHLEQELATQDSVIARTEREIALMQEYRTRLTADIVTGKLDVREAAARLPDLPAERDAEPADDSLDTAGMADDTETEED
jgi:type I restriction enzyme, S subunit